MHFNSSASGELFLTVSNIVTSESSVVTSKTIRPVQIDFYVEHETDWNVIIEFTWNDCGNYQETSPWYDREECRW